jgi:hypothetical protein
MPIADNLKSPRQLASISSRKHMLHDRQCVVSPDGSALLQKHLAKMRNSMRHETHLLRFRHHQNQARKTFGHPSCNVGGISLVILIEMLLHYLVDIAVEAFGHTLNPFYGTGRKPLVAAYSILPILRATACILATSAAWSTTPSERSMSIGSSPGARGLFETGHFCNTPIFTGVSGASIEAIVLYVHTGTDSTSRIIMFQDTGVTGLPLTPDAATCRSPWTQGVGSSSDSVPAEPQGWNSPFLRGVRFVTSTHFRRR